MDCVKLAGRKVDTWWLRQHPKVQELPFVAGTKRQDRVNARVAYIDGVAPGSPEEEAFLELLETAPAPLTDDDKSGFVDGLEGVCVSSDAFFPFPDGLLEAAAAGATTVIQPGGSMRDAEVIAAADEAGLAMVFTGMRHFRH